MNTANIKSWPNHRQVELVPQPGMKWPSENNFAICFLLEIPVRGFPFQVKLSDKYRIPKNNTNIICQRIYFGKGNPLRGISSRRHIANILS